MGVGRSSLGMIISRITPHWESGDSRTSLGSASAMTLGMSLTSGPSLPPLKHLAWSSYKAPGRGKNLTNVRNVCHQVHFVDIFGVLSIRDEN